MRFPDVFLGEKKFIFPEPDLEFCFAAKTKRYQVISATVAAAVIESTCMKYKKYIRQSNSPAGFGLFIKLIIKLITISTKLIAGVFREYRKIYRFSWSFPGP